MSESPIPVTAYQRTLDEFYTLGCFGNERLYAKNNPSRVTNTPLKSQGSNGFAHHQQETGADAEHCEDESDHFGRRNPPQEVADPSAQTDLGGGSAGRR